jgi:hypothetical protein
VKYFRAAPLIALLIGMAAPMAMAGDHSIPKDRARLSAGEWFPYVVSKLAPLEWWTFSASSKDVRREEYPSDWSYNLAKQNTWEFPRFCFSLFRPKPELFGSLFGAVDKYQGDVVWVMHDGCIGAMPTRPTFYTPLSTAQDVESLTTAIQNPLQPDPDFVKRALMDIPKFCMYLESALGLTAKSSLDFDREWLTREGLTRSRSELEDFVERGSWSVFLARQPETYGHNFQPTSSEDRSLSFGIDMFEHDALFKELGADWNKFQEHGSVGPILPDYPMLSRLDDITDDAVYQPTEVNALLAELLRSQGVVKDPRAVRGVDKFVRIARWAQKLGLGIYFGGQ